MFIKLNIKDKILKNHSPYPLWINTNHVFALRRTYPNYLIGSVAGVLEREKERERERDELSYVRNFEW
jgi:hypothetical protein